MPGRAADHEHDGRRLERDRLAHRLGPDVEDLADPELDLLAVAREARAAAQEHVRLLLVPVVDLGMGDDQLLALVRLVLVHAEAQDPELGPDRSPAGAVARRPCPLIPEALGLDPAELVEARRSPERPFDRCHAALPPPTVD